MELKLTKNNKLQTIADGFLLLAGFAAFTLLGVRAYEIFFSLAPAEVVTSGFEEESLFALYRYFQGQAVYTDPFAAPYTAAYFNWLFYVIYGSWIKLWLSSLNLDFNWLATVGRTLTLTISLSALAVTYYFIQVKQVCEQKISKSVFWGLSLWLWAGPLLGYWALTVRPDVMALFFEAIAACTFLYWLQQPKAKRLFVVAVLCYLAWGMKQINIALPVTISLFLLINRRFKDWLVFCGLMFAMLAVTLVLAPKTMLNMLFFSNTAVNLQLAVFLENFSKFFSKTVPVIILFLVVTLTAIKQKHNVKLSSAFSFSILGLIVWSLTLLPASSKLGAGDNYHFLASFWFILAVFSLDVKVNTNILNISKLTSAAIGITIITAVFFGSGSYSLRQQHVQNQNLRQCLANCIAPIFVINHYGALPWIDKSDQHYMLAYNYWLDRADGKTFAEDGIGGLIKQGYFNTLVLPAVIPNKFDGADLNQYQRQENLCNGLAIYNKIKS